MLGRSTVRTGESIAWAPASNPTVVPSLGDIIRAQRLTRGLSEAALTERARAHGNPRCEQSTIARIETGRTHASKLSQLRALAAAFDLPLHALLDATPWRAPAPSFPPTVPPVVQIPVTAPGTTVAVAGSANARLTVVPVTCHEWRCQAEADIAHANALVCQSLLMVEQSEAASSERPTPPEVDTRMSCESGTPYVNDEP